MRISNKHLNQLQIILLEITGKEYSSEELQNAGLSILRLVYALEIRKHLNTSVKEVNPQINNEVLPQTGHTSQERNI